MRPPTCPPERRAGSGASAPSQRRPNGQAARVVCIDAGRIVFDLPKDVITDEMGIARCRVADFEKIACSGMVPDSELRYLRHDYGIDVLVPDRYDFARRFPETPCDRMTIDDYLTLILKGGAR